MQVVNTFRLH